MATQFLSNDYLGPAYTLQPHPHSRTNGLHAAPSKYGGLIWAIVPSPEHAGKFNICTTHNGRPKCLDIYNDGSSDRTRVCLADPGHYSGQTWSLEPQGHGRCKLSNDWTGPGWYLDTYSDYHEAFVSRGDFSGQQWLISVPLVATRRHLTSNRTTSPALIRFRAATDLNPLARIPPTESYRLAKTVSGLWSDRTASKP